MLKNRKRKRCKQDHSYICPRSKYRVHAIIALQLASKWLKAAKGSLPPTILQLFIIVKKKGDVDEKARSLFQIFMRTFPFKAVSSTNKKGKIN